MMDRAPFKSPKPRRCGIMVENYDEGISAPEGRHYKKGYKGNV
jgi:hypothetical protein